MQSREEESDVSLLNWVKLDGSTVFDQTTVTCRLSTKHTECNEYQLQIERNREQVECFLINPGRSNSA